MKYQEEFTGGISEFSAFIKNALADLSAEKLSVQGEKVSIPKGAQLDYKVKYDDDETGGSISIKASWENDLEVD